MTSRNMHQKIICRAQVFTPTTAGEQQETLEDIAEVWAEIIATKGDVTIIARQSKITATYKVRIRYQEKLWATRSVLWQGKIYGVLSMVNPDNRQHVLEIQMSEDQP